MLKNEQFALYGQVLTGEETELELAKLARKRYLKLKMRQRLAHEVGDDPDTITDFLRTRLDLGLSKWAMRKVREVINFVGYRTWPTHRLIRKFSLQKFRRAVRDNHEETAWSIIAHAQRTSSIDALRTLINRRPAMAERLPASHKTRLRLC